MVQKESFHSHFSYRGVQLNYIGENLQKKYVLLSFFASFFKNHPQSRIVFQCSSSDTKWIHGLQETVHDLRTSFFLKSSVALGMRRLAGRLHIETVKRSLRSRYATCQPTWAFQGPHETSETMMWADHELFWAAHVFIEDRRRSIERISRF